VMACCGFGPTFNALDRMGVANSDTVVVSGCGPVGLGGVIQAVARGAGVIALETVPYRAELARRLGATDVIDPRDPDARAKVRALTAGRGADAAIEAGKHVLCEKPLGLTAEGAAAVLAASRAADVTVMVGFNYRFLPAVRLAYELIRAGRLGEIRQCRFHYLQQGHADLRRPLAKAIVPGEETAGAMASLGSHIIDLARWLVGEITAVSATLPRIAAERIGVDGTRQSIAWDDAVAALVEFDNGASGVLEASRVATGNRNALQFELHGSAGKLGFDLERPNELQVFFADDEATLRGTRTVSVTDPQHPYAGIWWPTGHVLGWEHAHMNEIAHFAQVAARGGSVAPLGATAEDGYRAALVADAITMSHSERRWQELPPREEEQ
jgi:predicted dehydrogenase